MMKPIHDAAHSALELPLSPADASGFPYRMPEENRAPGSLPLCPTYGALPGTLSYDVTGLPSLTDAAAEQKLRAEDLRRLLLYLSQALSRFPAHLLSPDGLILNADVVYLDLQSRAPCFFYRPGQRVDFADSFSALLHALLTLIDQNEEWHMVLAYRFYQESLSHPHSLDYLERILAAVEVTPRATDPAVGAAPPLDPLVSEIREVSAEEFPQKRSDGLPHHLFHCTEEPNHSAEDTVFLEALRGPWVFFTGGFLLAAFSLVGFFAPVVFLTAGLFVLAAFLAAGFPVTAVPFVVSFFVPSNPKIRTPHAGNGASRQNGFWLHSPGFAR